MYQNTIFQRGVSIGFVWLGLSAAASAYTCPLAQEYSDEFQSRGADYNRVTITASYEDIGRSDIQLVGKPTW